MSERGAVIFLFDRNYLGPFKVFYFTARDAFQYMEEDLLILTDDDAVKKDPFLIAIGATIIKLTKEDVDRLSDVNSRRIRSAYKTPKLSAYWLLKFYIFKQLGYDYHIFLDADMLCLRREFRFSELKCAADFGCARTVGHTKLGLAEDTDFLNLPEAEQLRVMETSSRIIKAKSKRDNMMNTGVVFASGKMIGDNVADQLIQISTNEAFRLEQDVVHAYIQRNDEVIFEPISVALNFPTLPAYAVGIDLFHKQLKKQISILHYNRDPKPWLSERDKDFLVSFWWHRADKAAAWVKLRTKELQAKKRVAPAVSDI